MVWFPLESEGRSTRRAGPNGGQKVVVPAQPSGRPLPLPPYLGHHMLGQGPPPHTHTGERSPLYAVPRFEH